MAGGIKAGQLATDVQIGGAGGGSFVWELNGAISAFEQSENGISTLDFDGFSNMEIYAMVTVPDSYNAGDQIQLKDAKFFSADAADNVYFRTQTTLFKPGESLLTDVNTHVSTNTEETLTAANQIVNLPNFDLTTGAGLINGIAVAAGDVLKIRLFRDNTAETVSSVEDARFLKFSATISFKP